MAFDFPAFSLVFFVGGILCVIFSVVTWSRRPSPGSLPFSAFMLAMSVWLFARALESGAVTFHDKTIWASVEYFGVVFVGSLWLAFASDYAGLSWWRRPRNLALLMFLPVVSLCLVWTNPWHEWVWPSITPSPGTSGTILI